MELSAITNLVAHYKELMPPDLKICVVDYPYYILTIPFLKDE
jgi:hypothetical protein